MPPMTESRARWSAILFDFDGTLVDSAPAILSAYHEAFRTCAVQPVVTPEPRLIGPTLTDTLSILAGSPEPALLEALTIAFKTSYDRSCELHTPAFEGVEALLTGLFMQGIRLFIATNKRAFPTHKIITHLGWAHWFEGVYALDSFTPSKPDKSALIQQIMQDHRLPGASTLYVGDRQEDGVAAAANELPFYFATWGYQSHQALDSALPPDWVTLRQPLVSAFLA